MNVNITIPSEILDKMDGEIGLTLDEVRVLTIQRDPQMADRSLWRKVEKAIEASILPAMPEQKEEEVVVKSAHPAGENRERWIDTGKLRRFTHTGKPRPWEPGAKFKTNTAIVRQTLWRPERALRRCVAMPDDVREKFADFIAEVASKGLPGNAEGELVELIRVSDGAFNNKNKDIATKDALAALSDRHLDKFVETVKAMQTPQIEHKPKDGDDTSVVTH